MKSSPRGIAHVLAYIRASRTVIDWIRGARSFALISGALESGILALLASEVTADQIAEATGGSAERLTDLLAALVAHGIVQRAGSCFRLASDYAFLASPSAAIPLSSLVRYATLMNHAVETLGAGGEAYTELASTDVFSVAEGSGISALSAAGRVTAESIGATLPEVRARWIAGAHHLEVGCGVGNALLGIVSRYPDVTAVGLEINEGVATECRRRSELLQLADRTKVRAMDACDLSEDSCYDTIQWSQFFFPDSARVTVLDAMLRALKPGGHLFAPLLETDVGTLRSHRGEMVRMTLGALLARRPGVVPYLGDAIADNRKRRKDEQRAAALNRMIFKGWGVPVRTVGELTSEVTSSGFEVIAVRRSPVNQFALTRYFLLARRPA
jgi:ubiquinone/menaquinone biosynthesis C-methylase UbiE